MGCLHSYFQSTSMNLVSVSLSTLAGRLVSKCCVDAPLMSYLYWSVWAAIIQTRCLLGPNFKAQPGPSSNLRMSSNFQTQLDTSSIQTCVSATAAASSFGHGLVGVSRFLCLWTISGHFLPVESARWQSCYAVEREAQQLVDMLSPQHIEHSRVGLASWSKACSSCHADPTVRQRWPEPTWGDQIVFRSDLTRTQHL